MDKTWINNSRASVEYCKGVESFLEFATSCNEFNNYLHCPCRRCSNTTKCTVAIVKNHLYENGFDPNYTCWFWHGEQLNTPTEGNWTDRLINESDDGVDYVYSVAYNDDVNVYDEINEESISMEGTDGCHQNNIYNRVHPEDEDDIVELSDEGELDDLAHQVMFQNLDDNSINGGSVFLEYKTPLHDGFSEGSMLSTVLKLFRLKVSNGWSKKSFNELLQLTSELLPEGNTLPNSYYNVKKILQKVGLSYQKIHCYLNDCVLYRKALKDLDRCPICHVSCWKLDNDGLSFRVGIPNKVMWYLPIIPRLRRLFANEESATLMTWHSECRVNDGMLRHLTDSQQWKRLDKKIPLFGNECRNVRLGLCADGLNPHSQQSSQHSTWPVLLVVYNIPPWLCAKQKFVMLSTMIQGPKQSGNKIDTYLQPLIDDLLLLWISGVRTWDAQKNEFFQLRAALLWTINDYPAYGNLAGCVTKGKMACVICRDGTTSETFKHGMKQTYIGHRKWLPNNHPFRRKKKAFNSEEEHGEPPSVATGREIDSVLDDFGTLAGTSIIKFWKRRCIFWNLPYWSRLHIRHNLDVMHIEKNICESIVGTLLAMPLKTKDGLNCRLDMKDMGIRLELAHEETTAGTFLPHPCFVLSKIENKKVCRWLSDLKVPDGYASNIRSKVNVDALKLVNLKSHDFHVLMQQLLPVALRGSLSGPVREVITRLCLFFNKLCSAVIDPRELDDIQQEIVFVLCSLEMYFPPSFFDVMVHLSVHLVDEVRYCDPIFARWMYPFERYMKILKGYVRNRYRPEATMVESYVAEESIELCYEVLRGIPPVGLPVHKNRATTGGIFGPDVQYVDSKLLAQAHLYVLRNSDVVRPYVDAHMIVVRQRARELGKGLRWELNEHNQTFPSWLAVKVSEEIQSDTTLVNENLKWLSYGPRPTVLTYNEYVINGRKFYTQLRDSYSTVQNSGVKLAAGTINGSRTGNNELNQFYGKIEHIWELDYAQFRIPVFKYKWANISGGVRVDEMGFTIVDFNRIGHTNEAFILAEQEVPVFYVRDPSNPRLSIVLLYDSRRGRGYEDSLNIEDQNLYATTYRKFSTSAEDTDDEPHYRHGLNNEGVLIRRNTNKRKPTVTNT